MRNTPVNIDFEQIGAALQKYVREKAAKSNSTIVYKEGDKLIEEDPKTSTKKILKVYRNSK